jgi:hypothetical protein
MVPIHFINWNRCFHDRHSSVLISLTTARPFHLIFPALFASAHIHRRLNAFPTSFDNGSFHLFF